MHYTVKDVQVSPHEKVLHLVGSYTQEQVVAHLQDGWHDTPVEPDHSVNLIADKTVGSDGLLHATCDFNTGTHEHAHAMLSVNWRHCHLCWSSSCKDFKTPLCHCSECMDVAIAVEVDYR